MKQANRHAATTMDSHNSLVTTDGAACPLSLASRYTERVAEKRQAELGTLCGGLLRREIEPDEGVGQQVSGLEQVTGSVK